MSVFGAVGTFRANAARHKSVASVYRAALCLAVLLCGILTGSTPAAAQQNDAIGGSGRPKAGAGGRARIEATASLRWNKAPFDSSKGASTYWFHASVASGGKKTSGGFTINMKPRVTGNFTNLQVNGIDADKISSTARPPSGKPSVARIVGSCIYGGKTYNVQIDVTGDYKPDATSEMVRGSVRLKMTDAQAKASYEGVGVDRSSVTIWIN